MSPILLQQLNNISDQKTNVSFIIPGPRYSVRLQTARTENLKFKRLVFWDMLADKQTYSHADRSTSRMYTGGEKKTECAQWYRASRNLSATAELFALLRVFCILSSGAEEIGSPIQRLSAPRQSTPSKAEIPREQLPSSILVTSSRGCRACRACRRGCHEDASRKLLPSNLGLD